MNKPDIEPFKGQVTLLKFIKNNKGIIIFLFLFIFGLSHFANTPYFAGNPFFYFWNTNDHLGGEYWLIAKAIVAGKGFSNPFEADTGPTAWTSPVYPFFLALLLGIFKTKQHVILWILFFKNLILLFTGVLIYEIAKRTLFNIKAYFSLIVYAIWLVSFFWWFFLFTHDIWIVLAFVDIIFFMALGILANPEKRGIFAAWGIMGGFATLTNPILGPVWLSTVIVVFKKVNRKKAVMSLGISAIIVLVWMARNFIVFDRLIFVKSNLYYDAYQANYIEDKGVLHAYSFQRHPFFAVKDGSQSKYPGLGEAEFSALYKKKFLNRLKDEPYTFLRKVKNRFLAATLVYRLYFPGKPWEKFTWWKSFLQALSFGSMLFILLFRKNLYPYILLAVIMYGFFLAPYILISYYTRYLLPLTPLLVLFICWGIDCFYGKFIKGRAMFSKIANKDF